MALDLSTEMGDEHLQLLNLVVQFVYVVEERKILVFCFYEGRHQLINLNFHVVVRAGRGWGVG